MHSLSVSSHNKHFHLCGTSFEVFFSYLTAFSLQPPEISGASTNQVFVHFTEEKAQRGPERSWNLNLSLYIQRLVVSPFFPQFREKENL